ncbi:pyridoxine 5'-phosphate oxidase C-terminal domain-containing protein [Agromyces neolithicus]|uniref:Pyridoxine 5'-phosphate oxidase dimerisation C-terminal domain-containing protein n=1 Tax=Agromyces neolithicus TaxID=269420 RepID=A0ABN2M8K5_9MICO
MTGVADWLRAQPSLSGTAPELEFWQGSPARRHARIVYVNDDGAWSVVPLGGERANGAEAERGSL